MKQVGLITFHRPINYGAALQAVALSKTVESLGAACHLIDYRNPFFENMYSPFKMPTSRSVKSLLLTALSLPYRMKQKKGFERFIAENTHLTAQIYDKEALASQGERFDLYLTGSDQVFNLKCSGGETAYFLDFVKNKPKYSYAASLGDADISGDTVELCRTLLSDFASISMRERSGAEAVEKLTGKSCVCSLDPTLLLNKQEWTELVAKAPRFINEKYVLVYFMAASAEAHGEMMKAARRIADRQNCRIVLIGGSIHKQKDGLFYANPTSPYEFLSLFHGAEYVVTNSFHGTAFSVNFGKNFYSYVKPNLALEGRVENLLNLVGLTDRKFSYADEIKDGDFAVSFENAQALLDAERHVCKEYLRGIIHAE